MKILRMFRSAINGIIIALRTERNVRRFVVIGAIILIAIPFMPTAKLAILVMVIFTLISAEMMNTSIEKLCDFIHPEHHTEIGTIKDLSAGSVLILAVMALLIAIIIIMPEISRLLNEAI